MEITPIQPLRINPATAPSSAPKAAALDAPGQTSFSDLLEGLTRSESQANDLLGRMAAGEDVDLHDVMIATEENDVNFKVAMAIRDRLVDAYREIMRMNV